MPSQGETVETLVQQGLEHRGLLDLPRPGLIWLPADPPPQYLGPGVEENRATRSKKKFGNFGEKSPGWAQASWPGGGITPIRCLAGVSRCLAGVSRPYLY